MHTPKSTNRGIFDRVREHEKWEISPQRGQLANEARSRGWQSSDVGSNRLPSPGDTSSQDT